MEILLERDDILCAASDRVLLARWRGRVSRQAIDASEGIFHSFYERTKEPFAEIVIVKAGVPLPDKAARERLAVFTRQLERKLRATAFAYEGTGVAAMAVRTAASGILALSTAVIPAAIVARAEDAVPWLLRLKHITPQGAETLKADIGALRAIEP